MERVWRTMRQRCTDFLLGEADTHQVDQALWAWLDADYHRRPHAGLMGDTPRRRYLDSLPRQGAVLTPATLAKALEVPTRRQVRRDGTFDVGAVTWEVAGHHLLGKRIELVIDGLTERPIRAFYQGKPLRFGPCDPVANRSRKRAPSPPPEPNEAPPFDPIATLLQQARKVDDE
jgi:putative transposase